MGFSGTVYRIEEHSLTTQATADYEVHREQRRIRLPLESVSVRGQERIQGFLAFGGRVLPQKVLSLTIRPSGEPTVRFTDGTAEIRTAHNCADLYTACEDATAYVEWPEELVFVTTVTVPENLYKAMVSVDFSTADVQWQTIDTEEKRGMGIEAKVFAELK